MAACFVTVVRGDTNVGGCNFNGGNQSGVTCSGNTNDVNDKPNTASGVSVDLRWLAFLCILFNLGLMAGADTAGGCIIDGGNVQNFSCNNNTQTNINGNGTVINQSSGDATSSVLSPGAIAGIVLASLSVLIALLSFFASIVNKDAVVGEDRTPVRFFKRAPLYRIVEGCTLLFGCGTLGRLERSMGAFIQRGGKWHYWINQNAITPPFAELGVGPYMDKE